MYVLNDLTLSPAILFVCCFFFFHLILLFSLLSFEVPDTRGVVANSKSLDESASLAGLQSSISPLSVLVGWTAIFFFFLDCYFDET